MLYPKSTNTFTDEVTLVNEHGEYFTYDPKYLTLCNSDGEIIPHEKWTPEETEVLEELDEDYNNPAEEDEDE